MKSRNKTKSGTDVFLKSFIRFNKYQINIRILKSLSSLVSDFKSLPLYRTLKSKNIFQFQDESQVCSNTSVWIEHNSNCSSHCFCSDISCEFHFDLTSVSMGCHYFSPANSVSCIVYCVFYFVNKRYSFSLVPSCTRFIITVLNSYKGLIFLL